MTEYIFFAILISALVTFILRALPFIFFGGKRKMPEWLNKLGEILPSAIMAVLIVYCLRSSGSDFVGQGIPGIISVVIVAMTYKWKHSAFLSIISGTALYMILIRVL
ncbi:MAG: branched-chain amino acid transporter permease [Oscillospiraceae bacterium]